MEFRIQLETLVDDGWYPVVRYDTARGKPHRVILRPNGEQTNLASVLVTCRQHAIPILDYLVQLQQFGGAPSSLVTAAPLQARLPASSVSER